jgi:hypothetical protein
MILLLLILQERGYRRVWVVDTEYCQIGGERPRARCLCALDLFSGERREVWLAGVINPPCPFEMTADECFVFFAADADVGIFINLKWPIPRHVIDPRVEFMRVRNGLAPLKPLDGGDPDIATEKETKASKKRRKKPGPFSLSRIARHYEVPFIDDEAKGDFRDLALRPSDEYSDVEKRALVEYCSGDVVATAEVFRRVWEDAGLSDPQTLNQALIRGFYMSAAAWVQYIGTPIDLPLYRRLSMNAAALRAAIIAKNADRFDVYEKGRFNLKKYEAFLGGEQLLAGWPRTGKGQLARSGKVLERIAETHTIIGDFLRFLAAVDLMEGIGSSFNEVGEIETGREKNGDDKAKGLRISKSGRNRAPLLPFGAKTSAQHAARPGVPVHQSEVDALSDSPRRGPRNRSDRLACARNQNRRHPFRRPSPAGDVCARGSLHGIRDHPRAGAARGDRKIASGRSQNLQGPGFRSEAQRG